jgi:hypothetical protein
MWDHANRLILTLTKPHALLSFVALGWLDQDLPIDLVCMKQHMRISQVPCGLLSLEVLDQGSAAKLRWDLNLQFLANYWTAD